MQRRMTDSAPTQVGGWLFPLFLISALIFGGTWLYITWQSSQKVLPPGITMAQLAMGGMTREQAINAVEQAYDLPVTIYYRNQEITLLPEMVDLSLDVEATAASLDEILLAQSGVRGFVSYALNQLFRREVQVQEVIPVFNYSRERLDIFLERIAQQQDHEPSPPTWQPESGIFEPPRQGTRLDIEASRPLVIEALLSAVNREAHLVVEVSPAPASTLDVLREVLKAQLENETGVTGLFIKELRTGQELCLNCKVAFTGFSALKIAIATELGRQWEINQEGENAHLIQQLLQDHTHTLANDLLTQIGQGNTYAGAEQVTTLLHDLGLDNSFISTPYDLQEAIPHLSLATPANTRTDITTQPNPYIQTTPLEAGLLLEYLYQCTQSGGVLRFLHAQQITPAECQDILTWLEAPATHPAGNTPDPESAPAPLRFLDAGFPPDTQVAHRYDIVPPTYADMALVYSPSSNFIITAFLYRPQWDTQTGNADEDTFVDTFVTIGQLVFYYFNPDTSTTGMNP